MNRTEQRTTPYPDLKRMPPGIPFIIGNELAERFSFYGMKSILTVFMTRHLLNAAGEPAYLSDEYAKGVYHLFTAGAYFFPLVGAIISDVFWGKYRTILLISLMYCVGHGLLALMDLGPITGLWDMAPFLYGGLLLIAVGSGGIKPCVSAHVGDQFGTGNKHLLTQVFNWFYFSINLGAAMSTFMTPLLLAKVGPWAAFGLPGALMALATLTFWLGRNTFVHVPPSGRERFIAETFSPQGLRALKNLAPLFVIFVPVFWAIFDQTGSAWVLQAESMDRRFLGITWLESQVQVVNPVLILLLIPVFTYVVYPAMGSLFEPTPLRKIGFGLILTVAAFSISALIQMRIETLTAGTGGPDDLLWEKIVNSGESPESLADAVRAARAVGWSEEQLAPYQQAAEASPEDLWSAVIESGQRPDDVAGVVRIARDVLDWDQERTGPFLAKMPSIGWQFLAYFVLTSAEIMVSIVCLEFAYTQSPPRMKSFIMAIYLLGVSLGNLVVSGLNFVLDSTKDESGRTALDGSRYYWFFAAAMLITALIYIAFARSYTGQTYIQGEEADIDHAEAQAEGPDAH